MMKEAAKCCGECIWFDISGKKKMRKIHDLDKTPPLD